MAFGRIKRAFKKVKKAVTQVVEIVKDVVEFTFTGELSGTEGNDTLNAIGIAGTVKTKGGDDTVNMGAGAVDVEDTTGALNINGAAGSVRVRKTGSGNIRFRGAAGVADLRGKGSIDYAGAAFANHLETVSNDALLLFRGAGGSNTIKGEAASASASSSIDVDFAGAGARNQIMTRARSSKVDFVGGGIANSISVEADDAEVNFTGAGADNRITIGTFENDLDTALTTLPAAIPIAGSGAGGSQASSPASAVSAAVAAAEAAEERENTRAKLRFDGAGANNVIEVGANQTEIDFNGAGAHNSISATGYGANSAATVSYAGAGGYTEIDVLADRARVDFAGAGIVNSIFVQSDDGAVDFDGIGAGNTVEVVAQTERGSASRAKVDFTGGGGANLIATRAAQTQITFRGAGAYNRIQAEGLGVNSRADVDFGGAGGWNVIDVAADRGQVRFAGAGSRNEVCFKTRNGSINFAGGGVANIVELLAKDGAGDSTGDIDFTGGGAGNVLRSTMEHGDIHFSGLGGSNEIRRIGSDTATGDVTFTGGGASNFITSRVLTGDLVFRGGGANNKVTRWRAGTDTRGDVDFAGAGGKNTVLSWVDHGDIRFDGVGLGNDVRRASNAAESSGDVVFRGGGGANVVRNEVTTGDIDFTGVGAANIITRSTKHANSQGDIRFTGAGGANVITSAVNRGDIRFVGAGAANVLTRLDTGADSEGDIHFQGAGYGNGLTSTVDHGDIVFVGAGAANAVTRLGDTGSTGDVVFHGVGLGNVVTHLTDHGDTTFIGGGGGNFVTRTGRSGDLEFTGAGLANSIYHDVEQGDLTVTAMGGGNRVERHGAGNADLTLGGALNLVSVDMGRAAGGAPALPPSDVNATMVGRANVLNTDVTGTTKAVLVGTANVVDIKGHADVNAVGALNIIKTGAHADTIRTAGVANVITTSGDHNHIESYGAFTTIRDGGEDTTASVTQPGELKLVDVVARSTNAVIDTTIAEIETGGEGEGGMFSDPSVYLSAIDEALAMGEQAGLDTSEEDAAALPAETAETGASAASLIGDDWTVMTEDELAQRGEAASADSAAGDVPAIDQTALLAGVEAELGRHAETLEKAQQTPEQASAEAEAAGRAAAEAEEAEEAEGDDAHSVAEGTDIPALGNPEDDQNGGIGAGAGGGFELSFGDHNFAMLLGLANVASFGAKDDIVVALSAMNYISGGDGDDIALMLGVGNAFLGGAGNDVVVQAAAGNVALMGSGAEDVSIQLGMGNFVNKDADGNLYAFALGHSNFVYHGGLKPGETANKQGNLVAVMGGQLNVAHKQGDGAVTGVMAGSINSLSHVGEGRYVAVMLGSLNVATKIGGGDAYFFMGGSTNIATHVNTGGSDDTAIFIMAGSLNVATSVGDGTMVGVFLGSTNIVTRVGNGTVGVGMLGSVNVLTVVNSETSSMYAAVGGKLNAVTKVGDGVLVAIGYGGSANILTHVGDGTMVAVQIGKLNVMTKIGNSYLGKDGKGATVLIGTGQANVVTHVGDGTTVIAADGVGNIATKVGDGATVALLNGQANIAIHVGDGMFIGLSKAKVREGSKAAKAGKTFDSSAAVTNALTAPASDGERAAGIFDILRTENGGTGHDGEEQQLGTGRLGRLLMPGNDREFAAMMMRFTNLAADVSTGLDDAASGMPGSGRNGPDLGGAADVIGDTAQKITTQATKAPSLSTMYTQAANQLSVNIGAKFGDGDVFFTQIGLSLLDKPKGSKTSLTEGDAGRELQAGAAQTGSQSALSDLLSIMSFDSSANIFLRIGDGRTVVAQTGSLNVVANYVDSIDSASTSEQNYRDSGPDHGLGFDFVHAAVGNANISVDISDDRVFVAGTPLGQIRTNAAGELQTSRGRDALSLFKGSFNASIKVGDGSSTRAMFGDNNLGVTIGNGSELGFSYGKHNLMVRIGSTIDGDDDNNMKLPWLPAKLDGMKATVGQNNVVIDYGYSNDLLFNVGHSWESKDKTDADQAKFSQKLSGSMAAVTDFGKTQLTYLTDMGKTGGPVSSKQSWDRNAASSFGSFASLAVLGVSFPGLANFGDKPGQNTSQFAKRTGQSQITKIPSALYSALSGMASGLTSPFTSNKSASEPEPHMTRYEIRQKREADQKADSTKPLTRNAQTYQDGYEIRQAMNTITGAYTDGFKKGGNIINAGAGADVVVTYGSGNLVFGDNASSFFVDFAVTAFFPANAQALSLNEIIAMYVNKPHDKDLDGIVNDQSNERFNKAATTQKRWTSTQRTIEFVEWFQNFGDIGVTVPYFTIGEMFNLGYDSKGAIVGYGTDGNAVAGQLANALWIDLTVPSSLFGGLLGGGGAQGLNMLTGTDTFQMAGTMLTGFMPDAFQEDTEFFETPGETEEVSEETDPMAALEDFMLNTDSEGDGSVGDMHFGASGFPVIPGIPNMESLYQTIVNFTDVVAVGEGGPLDSLLNMTEKMEILKGDGDVLLAIGGGNMQFGGHGDDIMVTLGEVGHNFGGYGNDFMLSIGKYGYLNGNAGDDYMFGLGAYNVIHDSQGHNTVFGFGDRNDIRLGDGNDTIIVAGNKSKARAGSGYNLLMVYGAKNSIYLAGSDVVFAVGGENNYYILGGSSSRALVHNIGAASVTLSPGAKVYIEAMSKGDTFRGSEGEDLLMFSRDSDQGELIGDSSAGTEELQRQAELDPSSFGEAWRALQDHGIVARDDTIVMRGRNVVAFGGAGGAKDRDLYVMGFGLKDGVILDAGGEKLGFGDETEDKIIIGEKLGLGDYSADLRDAPVIFRRDGDDLLIYAPDPVVYRDAPAPLDATALLDDDPDNDTDAMNSVRVKDYFNSRTANAAQVVLSVWSDSTKGATFLDDWKSEHNAEKAAAAAAAEAAGKDIQAVHTWSEHTFTDYTYLTRDGIKALLSAYAAARDEPGQTRTESEIWADLWQAQYDDAAQGWAADGKVRTGSDLSDYKIAQARGLYLAGGVTSDLIEGTGLDDTLEGGAGNDTLRGGAGNDIVLGGLGNDVLDGGEGEADLLEYLTLTSGVTVDLAAGTVSFQTGGVTYTDQITGFEMVSGTDHLDVMHGSAGNDSLFGNGGADVLMGHDGNDLLDPGAGTAFVYGGAGEDTIAVGDFITNNLPGVVTESELDGGEGSDWLDASGASRGVVVDMGQDRLTVGDTDVSFISIENVIGSHHDDSLASGAALNQMEGGGGDDLFSGDLAGDTIRGGDGTDTADFSAATAGVSVDLGQDSFTVGQTGTEGGIFEMEQIIGSAFDDTLRGRAEVTELFFGGLGINRLIGNLGDNDGVSYDRLTAAVVVDLAQGTAHSTGLSDSLTDITTVTGTGFDDQMTAGDTAATLSGGAGNDLLTGGAGDDQLSGGAGSDTLIGGAGFDLVDYSGEAASAGLRLDLAAGTATLDGVTDSLSGIEDVLGTGQDDELAGGAGSNMLIGGAGDDTLSGRGGDDMLDGGAGDDALFGGAGDDTLSGGEGHNLLVGGAGSDTYQVRAGSGSSVIEQPGFDIGAGPDALTTMDAESVDVLQIGAADETVSLQDIWFSQNGDHLLLEVLGDDGSVLSTHQISNWFALEDSAATRMDKFIVGDQVMQESATQQLVQAMASWSSDGGMLADRHTAMLADTGLQTALAAAWRPAT
ncbi:hypothetical protein ACFSDD_08285 [Salipiger marinus]|uniref:hypothetical protein n=1 Tax=Salipiger marinus TaxID=555512 RepID=UPI001E3BCE2A|nr:hypothetical protein [Salipiger manganoxidans]MCD1619550.1 hypothetical protein [Salipiger manganoxidans]MEB3419487.1 hypothetical protein [Salipiger manganoxidans]